MPVHAQALVSESMEYSPPGDLLQTYAPGGTGWSTPWVQRNGAWQVASDSLSYTDSEGRSLVTRGGKLRGSAAQYVRSFAAGPLGSVGSTIWVSLLAEQSSGQSANTFGGLSLITGPGTFLFLGKPFNSPNWGVDADPGATFTSSVPATQPAFLVLRVDLHAGLDDVRVWVNPPLTSELPNSSADLTLLGYGEFSNMFQALAETGGSGASIGMDLDEFRIGTTYSQVAPSVPYAVLQATSRDVGGCCYEFDVWQQDGAPGNYQQLLMSFPLGAIVGSADNGTMTGVPPPVVDANAGTIVWTVPNGGLTPDQTSPEYTVRVCFASLPSNSTVTFYRSGPPADLPFTLSGGCVATQACCDRWTQLRAPTSRTPTQSSQSAAAFDTRKGMAVLFGGLSPTGLSNETWLGNGWWFHQNIAGPSARYAHAMAYDDSRGVTVLYGGIGAGGTMLSDTWLYSSTSNTWTQVFPPGPGPQPVQSAAMAYDPISGRVLLIGGNTTPNATFASTQQVWSWDGSAWQPEAPLPAPLYDHAIAIEPTSGNLILHGGVKALSPTNAVPSDETIVWNGLTRTWGSPIPGGPTRHGHAMSFEPGCNEIVLFGGTADHPSSSIHALADLWAWNGVSWTQRSLANPPPPRWQHVMIAQTWAQRNLVYGGLDPQIHFIPGYRDTWTLWSGGPAVTTRGRIDNFAGSIDTFNPQPGTCLQNTYPTAVWTGCDDPSGNKFIGTNFTPQVSGQITKATLRVVARPLGGQSSNDTLSIGLTNCGTPWRWSRPFAQLAGASSTWQTDATTTFVLDLAHLPNADGTATNLLPLLSDPNGLDMLVQDDTRVDFIQLAIWTCPEQLNPIGPTTGTLGNASILPNESGRSFEVVGFTNSGLDGFSVDGSGSNGMDLLWDPVDFSALPLGAELTTNYFGTRAGQDAVVASTRFAKTASNQHQLWITTGTPTSTVRFYRGRTLLGTVTGWPSAQAITVGGNTAPTDTHFAFTDCDDCPLGQQVADVEKTYTSSGTNWPFAFTIGTQVFEFADRVRASPEGPQSPFQTFERAEVLGKSIDRLHVREARLKALGASWSSNSGHRMIFDGSNVVAINAGKGRDDDNGKGSDAGKGLSCVVGDVGSIDLGLPTLFSDNITPVGATMSLNFSGTFADLADRQIGTLSLEKCNCLPDGGISIRADYSSINVSSATLILSNAGQEVARIGSFTSSVAMPLGVPIRIIARPLKESRAALSVQVENPVRVVIGSNEYDADEVSFVSNASSLGSLSSWNGFTYQLDGVEHVAFSEVGTTPLTQSCVTSWGDDFEYDAGPVCRVGGWRTEASPTARCTSVSQAQAFSRARSLALTGQQIGEPTETRDALTHPIQFLQGGRWAFDGKIYVPSGSTVAATLGIADAFVPNFEGLPRDFVRVTVDALQSTISIDENVLMTVPSIPRDIWNSLHLECDLDNRTIDLWWNGTRILQDGQFMSQAGFGGVIAGLSAAATQLGAPNNIAVYVDDLALYAMCPNPCTADVDDGTFTGTPDGGVTIDDLLYYLALFEQGLVAADVDDGSATGTPDGGVTIDDLLYYLLHFEAGC